jgi:hypothetical protein
VLEQLLKSIPNQPKRYIHKVRGVCVFIFKTKGVPLEPEVLLVKLLFEKPFDSLLKGFEGLFS